MAVLVLGDDTRSFLAVVRSLGRRGVVVHAAPSDFSSPALASHYQQGVHRLPPYSVSPEAWLEALKALAAREGIRMVIPCDDRSVLPLQHHREDLAGIHVAVANDEALGIFFDKWKTRQLASSLGVPVARGEVVDGIDGAGLAKALGLPLALKPRSSCVLGQGGPRSTVRIVHGAAEADSVLARVDRQAWFAEAFFRGEGVGVSVLAEGGEVLAAFQHRRLHEASESGGSSSRVSEAVDPRLRADVEALARATKLSGVAMFEFRRGAGGYVLLEVNARFWGSLPLAVAAGADFPTWLHDLMLEGKPPAGADYAVGVVRRDLGGEYYRVLKQAERKTLPLRALAVARGFAALAPLLARGRSFDSWAEDDPAPFEEERRQLRDTLRNALAKRLTGRSSRERRAAQAVERASRAIRGGRRDLIMLCHGNICRSPFAEARVRARAAEAGLALDVVSAGTIEMEGRRSPEAAVAAARGFGIDLGGHRSRVLDPAEAEGAAAVVVFDERNVDELRRVGAPRANVIRLADLSGDREIADPYGQSEDGFAATYRTINRAVERLVSALAGAAR
jgi:protein-tyrosine-phosphatase/predicted ATP-grasp superfamily ATP-dependent carboligase